MVAVYVNINKYRYVEDKDMLGIQVFMNFEVETFYIKCLSHCLSIVNIRKDQQKQYVILNGKAKHPIEKIKVEKEKTTKERSVDETSVQK